MYNEFPIRLKSRACGRESRSFTVIALSLFVLVPFVSANSLRIVTYNIDADTGGAYGEMGGPISGPGLTTVLQAIGNAHLAGRAQPIDVLALQELDFSAQFTTLPFIVDQLNDIYGTGTYAYDMTTDPTTGGTGGGPNGLVYNTKTVQLLGGNAIGPASSSGAARAPMRYDLAPIGANDHSSDFTLYVSHMKAGSGSLNASRRNVEADELRTDAATLGRHAHIIYSGDYNVSDSGEAAYQTMVAAGLGSGQAFDPVNTTNDWNTTSSFKNVLTESAASLGSRFDFQFVTGPMFNEPGLQLVLDSYTAFGNGGNIFHASVTSGNNGAALADLGMSPFTPAYRTSVLAALTTTTDHLPLVADYLVAVPEPNAAALLVIGGCLAGFGAVRLRG